MKIIFYTSLSFLVYIYFLYPAIVFLSSKFSSTPEYNLNREPSISLLVAAHNEESVIRDKIQNCRDLNCTNLEVLIGSDGSDDSTVQVAREAIKNSENYQAFDLPKIGKVEVLNRLQEEASGDILVFSDANTVLDSDSITKLVAPFKNRNVGCVIGNLELTGLGVEKVYWHYRKAVRRAEYRLFGTTVGVNGGLWAIRKELVHKFPDQQVADDLWLPFKIARLGYDVAYEESAHARDETGDSIKTEIRRRVRVAYNNIKVMKGYLPPLNWFGFQYVSRKLLWQLMPLGYLGLLMSNFFLLQIPFFTWLLGVQLLFYLVGIMAIFWDLTLPWSIPGFALGMQWSLLRGLARGLVNLEPDWD